MTADEMAEIHRLAFADERPWSSSEFKGFIKDPLVHIFHEGHGFALTRTVAGESELLSLAVHPDHHRQGVARRLMQGWISALKTTADVAFLEVAADNLAALALYSGFGFSVSGKRVSYYQRTSGGAVDAFLMSRTIFDGKPGD